MEKSPAGSGDDGDATATHVDSTAAFEELLAADEQVFVDFYADWWGPYQMMTSAVDELATKSEATVVKLDVEAVPQVAATYDVTSILTFLRLRERNADRTARRDAAEAGTGSGHRVSDEVRLLPVKPPNNTEDAATDVTAE